MSACLQANGLMPDILGFRELLATFYGQEMSYGVSGLLYNSDVMLYDRQSESRWSQIDRLAISVPAKASGYSPYLWNRRVNDVAENGRYKGGACPTNPSSSRSRIIRSIALK